MVCKVAEVKSAEELWSIVGVASNVVKLPMSCVDSARNVELAGTLAVVSVATLLPVVLFAMFVWL